MPGGVAQGAAAAPQRRPVFLVGMMGAGKTTVGRLLAQALGYEFLDADAELERRAGVRIATMFEVEGEAGFRERESQLLDELTRRTGIVLATGGGAVLRADNRSRLRERGLVIFLDASAPEIARRTQHDAHRPLLQAPDRLARITALLDERLPLYRETAQLRFRSPARHPRRLVASLLEHPEIARLAGATSIGGTGAADAPGGT